MQEALTFDDLLIIPTFSNINSRKDVDLSNRYSKLPIISANMDTITEAKMAKTMLEYGGLACLHRFWTIEQNVAALTESAFEGRLPWASVGLGEYELERAKALFEAGARYLIIDVAHAAQLQVVNQYKAIKAAIPDIFLIVGNFATSASVNAFIQELNNDGTNRIKPDMIKVGIGPSPVCSTRLVTGVGIPQISALLDCSRLDIPMIADGGFKTSGDLAKALGIKNVVMCMTGSLLAGTEETPPVQQYLQKIWPAKRPPMPTHFNYRGSASKESYIDQGKTATWRTEEGISITVPFKGPVHNVLQTLEAGIRSSFTYVGASTLQEFQNNVQFVKITNNGVKESNTHGTIP